MQSIIQDKIKGHVPEFPKLMINSKESDPEMVILFTEFTGEVILRN